MQTIYCFIICLPPDSNNTISIGLKVWKIEELSLLKVCNTEKISSEVKFQLSSLIKFPVYKTNFPVFPFKLLENCTQIVDCNLKLSTEGVK